MNFKKNPPFTSDMPRYVKQLISWIKDIRSIDSIVLTEHPPLYTVVLKKAGAPDVLIDIDTNKKQVAFYTHELTNYPLTREIVPTKSPEISWFLSEILELQAQIRIAKVILLREEITKEKGEEDQKDLLRLHVSSTIPINGLTRQTMTVFIEEHFWLASQIADKIEQYRLPQTWRAIERDYRRRFEIPNF